MANSLSRPSGSSPMTTRVGSIGCAFNDGSFLETDLTLLDSGQGITWGFALGQFGTHSVLRITENGDWTELTEITVGSQPPRKFMELSVSPQKYSLGPLFRPLLKSEPPFLLQPFPQLPP